MFEKATKEKYRFISAKGNLTVEDLWDLPLTHSKALSLNGIAKVLNYEIKENGDESFVLEPTAVNDELETKFAIVKHIIKVRLAWKNALIITQDNKRKRDQILTLISEKKNDEHIFFRRIRDDTICISFTNFHKI